MPFEIVRNDITNMKVDAIVNTANPRPVIGAGTDAGIHAKAGPKLLEARKEIGEIRVGTAAITPGFSLDARFVIHTVGPVWQGGTYGEARLLRRSYDAALVLAVRSGCGSVAFPLISAGSYGFPKELALNIAIQAISEFLLGNEMMVYLVVFNREAFGLSEKLFRDVASYIDENYVEAVQRMEYGCYDGRSRRRGQQNRLPDRFGKPMVSESAMPMEPPIGMPAGNNLDEMLKNTDAGFSETLMKLIKQTGRKDSEIYTRANISRQHFSKIRSNPFYKPTKATAVAFAIALELDLDQTRDLIGRAGYALTKSSKFDVIIMYFIREGNYDLYEINSTLFRFDQSLLGV